MIMPSPESVIEHTEHSIVDPRARRDSRHQSSDPATYYWRSRLTREEKLGVSYTQVRLRVFRGLDRR